MAQINSKVEPRVEEKTILVIVNISSGKVQFLRLLKKKKLVVYVVYGELFKTWKSGAVGKRPQFIRKC